MGKRKLWKFVSPSIAFWALGPGAGHALADRFANQFVEFEAPPQWQCVLEGAEWICQTTSEARKRDAIIVLAAKLKGDQDSFEQYLAHLQKPKQYTSVQGKAITSQMKYAKSTEINEHTWIDSLHLDSELPGFYTRYLATIKEDIGVLVTYSINQAKYQEYLSQFEALAKTLRVFRKSGGLNVRPAGIGLFDKLPIPNGVSEQTAGFPPGPAGGADLPKSGREGGGDDFLLYLLAPAAVVGFILYKRRMSKD